MPSLKRKAPEFVRALGVLTPHPCPEEFLATSTHDESLALSKPWVPTDIVSVTKRHRRWRSESTGVEEGAARPLLASTGERDHKSPARGMFMC